MSARPVVRDHARHECRTEDIGVVVGSEEGTSSNCTREVAAKTVEGAPAPASFTALFSGTTVEVAC